MVKENSKYQFNPEDVIDLYSPYFKSYPYAGGGDLGNSGFKLTILDRPQDGLSLSNRLKSIVIPATYSYDKPHVGYTKSGVAAASKAFSVKIDGEELWFGPDVRLSEESISYIDHHKYTGDYLRILITGGIAAWEKAHSREIERGTLHLTFSMPPGPFSDMSKRKVAHNAYKAALSKPINIGGRFINISFRGMQPETLNYITQYRKLRNDKVLFVDIGLGSCDFALYEPDNDGPFDGSFFTTPLGLIGGIKTNMGDHRAAEKKIMTLTPEDWPGSLVSQYNKIHMSIQTIAHNLNGNSFNTLVLLGGGATLLKKRKDLYTQFKTLANNVPLKGIHLTSEANMLHSLQYINDIFQKKFIGNSLS